MTERLATEHLRIEYRDDPDLLALMDEYEALRASVAKLEEEVAEQSKEVTNAQWSLRRAGEREDALRARVAKLEDGITGYVEALEISRKAGFEAISERDSARAALKDAPQ